MQGNSEPSLFEKQNSFHWWRFDFEHKSCNSTAIVFPISHIHINVSYTELKMRAYYVMKLVEENGTSKAIWIRKTPTEFRFKSSSPCTFSYTNKTPLIIYNIWLSLRVHPLGTSSTYSLLSVFGMGRLQGWIPEPPITCNT